MEELLKSLEEMLKLRVRVEAVSLYPNRFPLIEVQLYNMYVNIERDALRGYINGLNMGIGIILNNLRDSNNPEIFKKLDDLLITTLPEYQKSVYGAK